MNKRICIFSPQYLPSNYGVEKYTYNLAKHLAEKNIEVTIVTSDLYGAETYEKKNNITVYRLPSYGWMKNRLPIIIYNRQFRSMLNEICKTTYDLCITNTRFYPLSLIGTLVGKRISKKNILIEHGSSHINLGNRLLSLCGEVYEHLITLFLKNNVNGYYGVSMECNKWLKHFNIEATGVLNNAVDYQVIEGIGIESIRNSLELRKDDLLIVYAGRLIKEKGVLQLVQAFLTLVRRYPNIKLLIAGEGYMLEELKINSSSNIYFLGQVTFERIINLLRDSDIFCLPSDSEGMPTSLLEAAICRNCIVSTKCGGIEEIVPDDTYGVIMESNSTEAIITALEEVIGDELKRKSMANKVYRNVKENFVWDKIADKICKEILEK